MIEDRFEYINIFDDDFGHFIKVRIEDNNVIVEEVDKVLYEETGTMPGIVLLYNDIYVSTLSSENAICVIDKVYKIDVEINKLYNEVSSIRIYVRG